MTNIMKQYFDYRILKSINVNTLMLNSNHIFKKLMVGATILRYATNRPFVRLNSLYHTIIVFLYD
jgi:hypothetical protein